LIHQIHGGGTENEKAICFLSMPASAVDNTAQSREQLRYTVDLVKDNEAILEAIEKQSGVGELGPVCRSFEVEIDGWRSLSDLMRQSGLSRLPWADQCDGRLSG
jgi:hypothetical protein